jgi:hypothetical protein
MPKSINKCPGCGEPVSPFAAGCAICGENLMAAREALAQRRQRIPGPARNFSLPRIGDDALAFGIGLILAIVSPIMGVVFGALMAWHSDSQGQVRRRNLMFVVIAVGVLPLTLGYWYLSPLLAGG